MTLARRILKGVALALGLGGYVWFAAVHNVPRVRERKARRRVACKR